MQCKTNTKVKSVENTTKIPHRKYKIYFSAYGFNEDTEGMLDNLDKGQPRSQSIFLLFILLTVCYGRETVANR